MLSLVVICCLVSSQVFGAAVLNNAHADAKVAHDYVADGDHTDTEYHESHTIKDSVYAYDKGSGHGEVDGKAVKAYDNAHHGYAAYPNNYGYGPAAHHAGAYVEGQANYDYAYDRGYGYNHEDAYAKDYKHSEDSSFKAGDYAAASHNGYNNGYAAAPYYYNNHYAASPFLHNLHKRSSYGSPAYGYGYYNYPAYNGYYGNNYYGYPSYGYYGNHHSGVHKRSAGYGYGYPAYNNYGYYGNHNGYYGNNHGYGYGYPYRHNNYGYH